MTNKLKAFILRRKISKKTNKPYWIAPYGNVDLLCFQDEATGDIICDYVERTQALPQRPPIQPNRASGEHHRPAIIPKPPIQKIIPRGNESHSHQPYIDHTASGYAPSSEPPGPEFGDPGPDPSDYGF